MEALPHCLHLDAFRTDQSLFVCLRGQIKMLRTEVMCGCLVAGIKCQASDSFVCVLGRRFTLSSGLQIWEESLVMC